VVVSLERGADLHMAQLMPLPLTVSCFSKIHIGFTFLVPAHLGSPGKRAVKPARVCVTDRNMFTPRHFHLHVSRALCNHLPFFQVKLGQLVRSSFLPALVSEKTFGYVRILISLQATCPACLTTNTIKALKEQL